MSRRALLAAVVVLSVAFGAGGFVGARWIRSPQEAAASRRPPPPSTLTAPVERRVLTDQVVVRGDVVAGRRLEVTLLPSGVSRSVVTGVRVHAGRPVASGQVLVEVSGRPVIALAGRVPAYRDLRPGATGPDVRQLQAALRRIGFGVGGDPVGTLGPDTQQALRRFYASVGYDVTTTGDDEDVQAARAGVKQARRALEAARRTLARARSGAHSSGAGSPYEIQDARRAVGFAVEDLADAQRAAARAERVSGPVLPVSEVVFVPELPAVVAEVKVSLGSPGDGVALSLDMGVPRVVATVDPDVSGLLRPGMPVTVFLEQPAREVEARIAWIGPGVDNGSGGLVHQVTIVAETRLPRAAVGQNVRIAAAAGSTGTKVLDLDGVSRTYLGPPALTALHPCDVRVRAGELVSVVGPSGSGKSTLLNLLGLIDRPSNGEYRLNGVRTNGLTEAQRAAIRGAWIGFVFQSFHLLPHRTAVENVALGLLYSGTDQKASLERAREVLERVGMTRRAEANPTQLSGGERQRVAIARALVHDPALLLCDEPTGNLDQVTAAGVLDLISEVHQGGQTVLIITHDPVVAARADRTLALRDGVLGEIS